jgi:prepilin-type N-terminal cleavage/methylation domain-containing protein
MNIINRRNIRRKAFTLIELIIFLVVGCVGLSLVIYVIAHFLRKIW